MNRNQHLIPTALGANWDSFVSEWCLGAPPSLDAGDIVRGLEALARLWPERVDEAAASSVRGLSVVVPLVDTGLTLSECESLAGFHSVFHRARGGERSAQFEMRFARHVQRAGYGVQLEPKLNGKVLDSLILDPEEPVYCEAIAPDSSEVMGTARESIARLSRELAASCAGRHVEVLLLKEVEEQFEADLLQRIADLPQSDMPAEIEGRAIVYVSSAPQHPVLSPKIPAPQSVAVLGAASAQVQGAVSSSAIVRVPMSDERVKRLIYAESHHFSRETKNVLVIDTTAVPGGMTGWVPLIQRTFQPDQNRRFGAVILHSRGMIGERLTLQERWRAIPNPFAYRPVAHEFLQRFSELL